MAMSDGIGHVPLAVHLVVVDLGLKGVFHLPRRAAEFYAAAAFRHAVHLKTAVLKPVGDDVQILLAGAESLAELPRRQPFVVLRRRRVLLFRQKLFQRGLLLGAAVEAPAACGPSPARQSTRPRSLASVASGCVVPCRRTSLWLSTACVIRCRGCACAVPAVTEASTPAAANLASHFPKPLWEVLVVMSLRLESAASSVARTCQPLVHI
jgi:hypothetical protein